MVFILSRREKILWLQKLDPQLSVKEANSFFCVSLRCIFSIFLDGNRVKLFRKFSLFSFLESIFRDFLKKNFLFYGKFSRDWTDFQRSLKTIYTIFDNFHIFILREALTYVKLFSLKNFFLHTKIYISCFHFLESALENFSLIKKFLKLF